MFKGQISLLTSLNITVISMLVVFFILSILAGILLLFKYIPKEEVSEKKKNPQKSVQSTKNTSFNPKNIKDDKMRTAMIVATLEMAKENKNSNIRVVNIKELN